MELSKMDCPICGEPLMTDVVWINPLGYQGTDPENQTTVLGPSVGTADSGGGYTAYHRDCAAAEWPELSLNSN